LEVDDWPGHVAGQHVDVRLTAEDGYSTQRSYSIASAPDGNQIELTIQLLEDGEISPFLVNYFGLDDLIEVRGPIGGWFVWDPADDVPAVLLGGGSGVVPLIAMVRAQRSAAMKSSLSLIYSVRTPDDVLFQGELSDEGNGLAVNVLYTRQSPEGTQRPVGRLMRSDIPEPQTARDRAYVCGPTGFVEAAAHLLVDIGYNERQIRTERFGPSGG
jgi:ferredoxin-NADP reductase